MDSTTILILSALLLTTAILLIVFTSKIISRLIFMRSWDSPFACVEYASPSIQLYISMTPGQHPYFRVLEEYEQKMDDLNISHQVNHGQKDVKLLIF
ncbi:hypothetical protein CDAR_91351 [Caerostris darwini]|uniref:Uncharacterized protein n=1 Tax=Caerostris darwini TaxID=1538125 RepID=A0AAV4WRI6_9ARAC|nr:hypothetical protein CDAR_91351 [Caerostris darwini]